MVRWPLLCVLVGLLALVPFVSALGGPYFWDDNDLIPNNPYVHSLSFAWRWFTHSYFDAGQGVSYGATNYLRPLSLASFALDWIWGSGNPAAFHATNLFLHLVTTLAIIGALSRWTSNRTGAAIAGLFLAWHPTRAESVAWISGRTDILVTLFILLACQARALRAKSRYLSLSAEVIATLAAYASKETAVVLPVFIALEAWIALGRPPLTSRGLVAIARRCVGQFSIAVAYLWLRSQWLKFTNDGESALLGLGLKPHVGLALQTLGRAIELAFLPLTQRGQHGLLALDADGTLRVNVPYALFGTFAFIAIIAVAILVRYRRPLVAWGCVVFLVSWLPTSNIVPTHLTCDLFERFLFLPSLGLALALLSAITNVEFEPRSRLPSAVLLLLALAFCAVRSYDRSCDYADPHRFWLHESRVNPLSSEAPIGLLSSRTTPISVRSALSLLGQCHRNALARGQVADAVRCTFEAAVLIADHTPELDEKAFASSVDFFRVICEQSPQQARIGSPFGSMSLDLTNSVQRKVIENRRAEALSVFASLRSRKRDPRGAQLAREAIAVCPHCQFIARAARALAGLGHTEEGLRALELSTISTSGFAVKTRLQIQQAADWQRSARGFDGAQKLHAEAQAFLSIGYFGAAYEILKPHRGEFERIPDVSADFARMAVYSGDTLTARQTLAPFLPPDEVSRQIEQWEYERDLVAP